MPKLLSAILIIIAITCACSEEESTENTTWKIVESPSEDCLLKKGTNITFLNGNIVCSGENSFQVFPVIISEEKMVIKTEKENFLFTINKTSDSVWILTELYKNTPAIIKITKIKN